MHSEHFSEAELACKHCGLNEVTPELINALEAFRKALGKPVKVDAAFRCPVHNAQVGGVRNSMHVLGMAADVRVDGLTAYEMYLYASQIPLIAGLGRDDYKNYLHIDVRPSSRLVHWCYGKDGKQTAWYEPLINDSGIVNA